MSKGIGPKELYKMSEMGKAEAYIKRFHNIAHMREAFEKSSEAKDFLNIKKEATEFHIKHTEEFEKLEKKFQEEQNARLLSDLNKMVNILRAYEKYYKELNGAPVPVKKSFIEKIFNK